jgi:basic membrane lipoprotein Med (substrate-binding protein (PBP1-ABC) superfamily)
MKYYNEIGTHLSLEKDAPVSPAPSNCYEGRYIQGVVAAKMSKSGVIGYIGSFPAPEVIASINATMLGAQSINPNIKIKIIWANSWFDPGKGADAAEALLRPGCRRDYAAYGFTGGDADRIRARQNGVRPRLRNDQVRTEDAVDLDHG